MICSKREKRNSKWAVGEVAQSADGVPHSPVLRVRVFDFSPGLSKFFRPFLGGVKNRENPHFFLLYPVGDDERRP
jgi:hypothetical protein